MGKLFVENVIRSFIARRATPGAQYAVARKDGISASGAVGQFTYDQNSPPVTPETIYDTASLTKVVAATSMAMLLWQQGRLDLEQPVCEIVPEFRQQPVTFHMLLAHTSGLPAHRPLYESCRDREEVFAAVCATPLEAPPGSRVDYSDLGFILLCLALERIAGERMDAYVTRNIFAPLQMSDTRYGPPEAWKQRIAPTNNATDSRHRLIQGEVHDENCWVMDGVSAHAGVFSTATDLAKFAACLLRGGAPIFQRATVEKFTRRETSPPGTTRALGWDTPSSPSSSSSGRYFSPSSYGHLGYTGTSIWIDPEADLGVILLTNRVWPNNKLPGIRQLRPAFHDAVRESLAADQAS